MPCSCHLSLYDLRQVQELRADAQSGLVGGIHVYLKTNPACLDFKIDDSALRGEVLRLPHRQHAGGLNFAEDGMKSLPFRGADEQDLAPSGGLIAGNLADQEGPAVDGLA